MKLLLIVGGPVLTIEFELDELELELDFEVDVVRVEPMAGLDDAKAAETLITDEVLAARLDDEVLAITSTASDAAGPASPTAALTFVE